MNYHLQSLMAAALTATAAFAQQTSKVPATATPPSIQSQEQSLARPPRRDEGVNPEQARKLREVNEKARQEQAGVSQKLMQARRELALAAQAEQIDEKIIREKAAVVGQLEGDLAVLRAKQYKEMRAVLPKEQAGRLNDPHQPGQVRSRLQEVVRRPGAGTNQPPVVRPQRPAAPPSSGTSATPAPK